MIIISERILEDINIKQYENTCVVYLITNLLTSMCYIGMTINIRNRINKYNSAVVSEKSHKNHIIVLAMKKYGISNFKIEIIDYSDEKKTLANLEKYYIKKLNTQRPHGYNISRGGLGGGYSCTEITKQKISKANKGRKRTVEQRARFKEAKNGYKHSEETKYKIGKSHKGQKRSAEFCAKISKIKKNMTVTPETRKKISESLRQLYSTRTKKQKPIKPKYKMTEQTKDKIRQSRLGKKQSEATKEKIAKSHIGIRPWLGKKHTEETKEKIRQSHIGQKRPDMSTDEARLRQKQNAKKLCKPVKCVETGVIYVSRNDAAKDLKVSAPMIAYSLKNNSKIKNQFTIIEVGE